MTTTDTAPAVAPAPTAPRRVNAWFVVGAVVAVAIVAVGAASFAGTLARHHDSTTLSIPAAATLVVEVGSGSVTITGSDRDDVAGTATTTWSFRQPRVVQRTVGDTVQLSADCDDFIGYCDVNFDLEVPAGTAVELSDGSGDVTATGLRADATLSTDSGMITATDVVGDVRARTGSGDIALSRVTGSLDLGADSGMVDVADASATQVTARTGSGDIHLGLSADPGTVDARADSGHVTVGLPDTAGVAYRLDLNAGSGLTSARVRTDPDSPRSVTVRTGSGDISVGYR